MTRVTGSNPQWNNKSLYHTVWVPSPRSSVIRHKIKEKNFFFPFPLLGSKTVCMCSLSRVWPFVASAYQAPLSMEFSRQEYCGGLPFPPPGDLSNPGIKPTSLLSPALAGKSFITELPGKPSGILLSCKKEWNRKKILSLTQSFVGRISGSIEQECPSWLREEIFLSSGSCPVRWCWEWREAVRGARMWGSRWKGGASWWDPSSNKGLLTFYLFHRAQPIPNPVFFLFLNSLRTPVQRIETTLDYTVISCF